MAAADDFFIGWLGRLPRGSAVPLGFAAGLFVAVMAGLAFSLSASTDDPGDGGFDWAAGPQTMLGVVVARPYPVLRLLPSATHPDGHAVMLAGWGKVGAQTPAEPLDGRNAVATGFLLKRGDLDMLQLDRLAAAATQAGTAGVATSAAASAPPAAVPLGRWRLTGEICDGKCTAGAMRPGTGLAHKACANLCLIGGLPPVFVTTSPVAGESFLMMGDADGGPLPGARMRDLTGLLVTLEGDVERIDDLLVFRTDIGKAEVR